MSEKIKEAAKKWAIDYDSNTRDVLELEPFMIECLAIAFTKGAEFMLEELLKEPDTILGLSSRVVKLQRQIAKLTEALEFSNRALTKNAEYFCAIAIGEYNENRRTAPLMDYEELIKNMSIEASLKNHEALKSCSQYDEQTEEKI